MSDVIRWGILATGGIAAKFTTDLALVPDAKAVAVASRSAGPAEKFAAEFGIDRAHASWQALADDPDVDVVYVAGPNNAHHAATKLLLEAGKPVLCEKPFTLRASETAELIAIARANGVFLAEAMWMRCNPAVRRARDLVMSGAIGEVRAIHADFSMRGATDPAHRVRNRELGGGALLDVGVYPMAFAQYMLGTPETIASHVRLTDTGVDESTAVLLGYASGAHAVLTCSIASGGPVTATIGGTAGRITLPEPFYRGETVIVQTDGEPERIDLPYEGNGLRFQAIEVNRCLHEGLTESPLLSLADALTVMTSMDTIRAQVGVAYPGE